ncbi:hypothetical protein [Nitrosomonas sp.]|uniref:hypothetical protein n=1 Tax=Nitrosomonas sp. TaxID=42353 RepID=UPI0020850704|nr:hypothetical protein [Nitrosomonas sp.]GJL76047.1 MAG: hypothetical protein NMNS02_21530 [Nitrosomonas sp.]
MTVQNTDTSKEPLTEAFANTLTELAAFKEYFTDDEKIKLLVEWLHEETKISKVSARLVVKHIAPLVLARLADLGKLMGDAWLRKLHGRLSQYSGYRNFTVWLLHILKTRTDKSYEAALDIPATANLEKLILSPGLWANLQSEQKAVVQLLLGQNDLSAGQNLLIQQLDQLTRSLAFDLDLNTPEFIEKQTEHAKSGSPQWLTYAHRQARLIGRGNDLQLLKNFIEQETLFSWWLIIGAGGIGKSRLALEALIRHQAQWDVGFLSKEKLGKPDAHSNWLPTAPTVIVIDYAAEQPEAIGAWMDHLLKHQTDYDFPVRLLILEREYRQQTWWEQLVPATTTGNRRKQALYLQTPHELRLLTAGEQQRALKSFLEDLDCTAVAVSLPEGNDIFWDTLQTLSNRGRPLFIGMAAVAIARHGLHEIRNWDQQALLDYVLRHEQEAWRLITTKAMPQYQDAIFDLLALSSVAAGFNHAVDEGALFETLNDLALFPNESLLEQSLNLLPFLAGQKMRICSPGITMAICNRIFLRNIFYCGIGELKAAN